MVVTKERITGSAEWQLEAESQRMNAALGTVGMHRAARLSSCMGPRACFRGVCVAERTSVQPSDRKSKTVMASRFQTLGSLLETLSIKSLNFMNRCNVEHCYRGVGVDDQVHVTVSHSSLAGNRRGSFFAVRNLQHPKPKPSAHKPSTLDPRP